MAMWIILCFLIGQHFGFDISPYKYVDSWYQRMTEIPGFEECDDGAREFGAIVTARISNSFDKLWIHDRVALLFLHTF